MLTSCILHKYFYIIFIIIVISYLYYITIILKYCSSQFSLIVYQSAILPLYLYHHNIR